MSGILERIEAKLDQLLAGAAAPQPVAQAVQTAPAAAVAPQTVAAAVDPLAGGSPAYPPATSEMITALITPHVGNPALKAALQQQMAAMGIGALPDAQPQQYAELHYRFQQVIANAQAQAAAAPVAAAAPASII